MELKVGFEGDSIKVDSHKLIDTFLEGGAVIFIINLLKSLCVGS